MNCLVTSKSDSAVTEVDELFAGISRQVIRVHPLNDGGGDKENNDGNNTYEDKWNEQNIPPWTFNVGK